MKLVAVAALAALLAGCAALPGAAVRGTRPAYLTATTEEVPNAAALRDRIWVPGLDETFVPQGLTSAGKYLFVSSYKPTPDLRSDTGPCRVFRVDMETGMAAGHFDIPPGACTHAGGLAHGNGGQLYLADTRTVFRIDVEKALAAGTAAGAMRSVKIAGDLRGSYGTFDGKDFWIGTWTREAARAPKLFRLDSRLFDDFDGQTVTHERATATIPVPVEAQGAAFDKAGNLWISASNSRWGKLYKLDPQGKVLAEYEMPAGLEDLTVDDQGRLWGMSESGTQRYLAWATRFPYIFRIDTGALK